MTHYQALELPETATPHDIRRAYRRLVLLTHPDRTPDPAAHARYLLINAAYEVLSDASRRQAYDWQLRAPMPSPVRNHSSGRARDARRRSAAQHPSSPAPKQRTSYYQDVYVRYADVGRLACKALLIFSLLIGLDRLWVIDYPREQVLQSNLYSSSKRASYCMVKTPHTSMRGQCFYTGQVLAMKRTALFKQVLSFHMVSTGSEEDSIEY